MSEYMRTYPVLKVIHHSKNLKSFIFPRIFDAEPGQFILLWIPGLDEKPFAVSGLSDSHMEITIRDIGFFTHAMMNMGEGDMLGLRGPFGRGFSLCDQMILIGGGIGNAPVRFLAQRLAELGKSFRWIVGVKTAGDLIFRDWVQNMPQCTLISDDGSLGQKGLVTDILPDLVEHAPPACLAAAGPEPMLAAIFEFAESSQPIIPVQLSFERYMKCAIGICGQCCMDGSGLRICVEGPVLGREQLKEITEIGLPHRGPSGRRADIS